MGVPNVVYKWKSLRKLYVSLFVMNVAGCLIVVIMIVSAVKLRMGVGQYLDLVVPGDANFWPGMMFLIAFMCAPIYAIGIKLCFHLRFVTPVSQSVPRINQVLFIHCALCFTSMIIVICINAFGILHAVNVNRINQNGIIDSMKDYATDVISKIRVDMIQINFKCCGSASFKDWFHLQWMQREAETQERKDRNESALVSTDVPFSCCSTDILRPCVHHNILKPSEVYLYRPEHRLTIATTGCHAKVLTHARYIGGLLIMGLILLAAYQMVLALLSRLLQTAHSNALYIGPKKDRYIAWILGSMPDADMYDRLVYKEGEINDEEMSPLREPTDFGLSSLGTVKKCRSSDNRIQDPSEREFSQVSLLDKPPSTTTVSKEKLRKSSTIVVVDEQFSNSSANSIPTPPPSPGDEDHGIRPVKSGELKKGKSDVLKKKESHLKVPRESLECLENCQSPWRGESPIFETRNSGSRVDLSKKNENLEILKSSTTSSSDDKNRKICVKDSTEENEIRIKKFCKDLSTEYKKSPYLKQRRDFSEPQYKFQDPTRRLGTRLDEIDEGRMIRNEVYARFNPADTYSRFRGSNQDTMMRRGSQTQPGPPPIPIISDQRTFTLKNPPRQHRQKVVGPCKFQNQKPTWRCAAPHHPQIPTYFPISTRPPRPPRLPPCPDQSQFRCSGRCAASGLKPPRFSGC